MGIITKEQAQRLEWLSEEIIFHDGFGSLGHSDEYEYRGFDINISEPVFRSGGRLVFLRTEVARQNAVPYSLTTKYRHIKIGPRGGMTLLNGTTKATGGRVVYWTTK